jgi:hypothetical protein
MVIGKFGGTYNGDISKSSKEAGHYSLFKL